MYDEGMTSITDTPVLVTPPEHELPEVLAFWDAYDDAHDHLCETGDNEPLINLISDLISTVYKTARP